MLAQNHFLGFESLHPEFRLATLAPHLLAQLLHRRQRHPIGIDRGEVVIVSAQTGGQGFNLRGRDDGHYGFLHDAALPMTRGWRRDGCPNRPSP